MHATQPSRALRRGTVHSKLLPGVTAERVMHDEDHEIRRDAVYLDDEWVGEVVYVERGDEYGWRPTDAVFSRLTCRVVAIRSLPRLTKEVA